MSLYLNYKRMDIASDTVHIIRCILLPKVRILTSLNTRGRKSIKDKKIISITWRDVTVYV